MGRKSEYDELLTALGLDEPEAGDVTPQLRALVDRMRAEAARPVADPSAHISAAAAAAREAVASSPFDRPAPVPSRSRRFGEVMARVAGAVTLVAAGLVGVVASGTLEPGEVWDEEEAVVSDSSRVVFIPSSEGTVTEDALLRVFLDSIATEFAGIDVFYVAGSGDEVTVVMDPTLFGGNDEVRYLAYEILVRLQMRLGQGATVHVDATGSGITDSDPIPAW